MNLPGRPPKQPEFLHLDLARSFVRGKTLSRALRHHDIHLSDAEMRNIYRLKRWKELVSEATAERQAELDAELGARLRAYLRSRSRADSVEMDEKG